MTTTIPTLAEMEARRRELEAITANVTIESNFTQVAAAREELAVLGPAISRERQRLADEQAAAKRAQRLARMGELAKQATTAQTDVENGRAAIEAVLVELMPTLRAAYDRWRTARNEFVQVLAEVVPEVQPSYDHPPRVHQAARAVYAELGNRTSLEAVRMPVNGLNYPGDLSYTRAPLQYESAIDQAEYIARLAAENGR